MLSTPSRVHGRLLIREGYPAGWSASAILIGSVSLRRLSGRSAVRVDDQVYLRLVAGAPAGVLAGLGVERDEVAAAHHSGGRLVGVAAVDGDDDGDPLAAVEREEDVLRYEDPDVVAAGRLEHCSKGGHVEVSCSVGVNETSGWRASRERARMCAVSTGAPAGTHRWGLQIHTLRRLPRTNPSSQ